jgi:transcriptional regulator with XRE-family HTH domain
MIEPNGTLRTIRMAMRLSQDEFARALRDAGTRSGDVTYANKRLVQRWESGEIRTPQPAYARALEAVTRRPIDSLGFRLPGVHDDTRGGHDLVPGPRPAPVPAPTGQSSPHGNHTGVWLSRYEYFSSGRSGVFVGRHFVLVMQDGDRLTVQSLDGSVSSVHMDLTLDGSVITGTWVEQTQVDGYYRGARYHGAIQMLVEPTGRRMSGKWVGFGKDMDVNTGPWELIFQDASTNKATLEKYGREPDPEPEADGTGSNIDSRK